MTFSIRTSCAVERPVAVPPLRIKSTEPQLLGRAVEEVPAAIKLQRGLRHARAVRVQNGNLPDGGEHHPLAHKLLDTMAGWPPAALSVALAGLFPDESLDVR